MFIKNPNCLSPALFISMLYCGKKKCSFMPFPVENLGRQEDRYVELEVEQNETLEELGKYRVVL